MKTNLIISLALGLFLGSCQNNSEQPKAKSGTSEKKLSAELSQQSSDCISYSVFNPHGPMGTTILFFYLDCSGQSQSGSVEPQESVGVMAQPGSIKCNDCVVTEGGNGPKGKRKGESPKIDADQPNQSKP